MGLWDVLCTILVLFPTGDLIMKGDTHYWYDKRAKPLEVLLNTMEPFSCILLLLFRVTYSFLTIAF
jgi:hypothetical protein